MFAPSLSHCGNQKLKLRTSRVGKYRHHLLTPSRFVFGNPRSDLIGRKSGSKKLRAQNALPGESQCPGRPSGSGPRNAMTLSGVTRRTGAGERRRIQTAGSLRIETFEGSRPRLRRTRQVWVLNHPGSLGRGFSGNGESANVSLPTRGRRRKEQCKLPESGFWRRIWAFEGL